MTDSRGLQHQVSTNVKVLMAIHGIGTQTELATRLGWDRTLMANRFSGKRAWKIEDLAELGELFGVGPGALLGDTANLIGAMGPTQTVGNGSGIHGYFHRNPRSVTVLAQVIDLDSRRKGVALSDAPNRTTMRHVG